jgi:DNA-binding LacI/PurR family transcriptional regulator
VIKKRDIDHLKGIFTFEDISCSEELLQSHNIPTVGINHFCTKYAVKFFSKEFIKPGLDFFGKIGCSSIAIIGLRENNCVYCSIKTKHGNLDEWKDENKITCLKFSEIEDLSEVERCGYEAFRALWRSESKIDGVLITDNVLAQGALRAIVQLGISMPDELKLISHATRGVKLPYEQTVTRLECDFSALANEAINMMEQLIAGHKPDSERIVMKPELIIGETT